MNRCKMLLLALISIVGISLTAGCNNDANKDSSDEEASAKPAETNKEDNSKAGSAELPLEATGPVAIVDGDEIGADKFNKTVKKRSKAMGGRTMPARMAQMMKGRTVKRLIDEHLIDQKISKMDIDVDQSKVDAEFQKVKDKFPNEEKFKSFLDKNGLSVDEMKTKLKKDLKLRTVLEDKYGIEVDEKAAKKEYDDNPSRFKRPVQVRASHILIKVKKGADDASVEKAKKRAQALAKKAKKSGTDFAELAKKESEGPSGSKGGDLGYFSKGDMVPAFSKVAFEMKPGDISEPVKSRFGFHIIKMVDKREAGKVPFDEAKDKIVGRLKRQKYGKAMRKYLAELKKDVEIEKKLDNIKVNVKAPKGGSGSPHMMGGGGGGGGKIDREKLQKMIQKKMKQKQKADKGGDKAQKKDPTEVKIDKPDMLKDDK